VVGWSVAAALVVLAVIVLVVKLGWHGPVSPVSRVSPLSLVWPVPPVFAPASLPFSLLPCARRRSRSRKRARRPAGARAAHDGRVESGTDARVAFERTW